MQRLKKMQCPVCKGAGSVLPPHSRNSEFRKLPAKKRRVIHNSIIAKLLHKEGYSYREIADFLGYVSKRSVQLCLQREDYGTQRGNERLVRKRKVENAENSGRHITGVQNHNTVEG